MSKFTESMIGTDWHSEDIATAEERTSTQLGIALVVGSAIVSFIAFVALMWWAVT